MTGKMAGQQQQRPVSVHVLSSEMIKISAGATDQKIKVPKPVPLRVKAGADGSAGASDSSPSTDDVKPPFNRSTSDPSSTTPSRLIVNPTNNSSAFPSARNLLKFIFFF
jgi:hypothetical protein